MTLNGTLEDFSPAGILKVLSADGRTGAVRFGGPYGCTVYLHRGQLYFARNESTDAGLATALVRPGRLSADDWGQAIDEAGDRPVVGELLVRNDAITSDLLASVVLSVVYDPLIDLFRDGTGEFDFEPDTVHWLGPFRAFPVDAIVGEVKKRVREVDEWSAAIPSLDSWVEASRTLPGNAAQVTILREDWELVTALSGPRTIRDLATELGRGAYSAARVVNRLHQAGLVQVVAGDVEAEVVPLRRVEPVAETEDRYDTQPDADRYEPEDRPKVVIPEVDPFSDMFASASDLLGTSSPASAPAGTDDTDLFGDHGADIHHEGISEEDETDEPAGDPNAAWLEDLYAQFIDEPEAAAAANGAGKKRRRGEPNPVDVAFRTEEQDDEAKVSTLKRLMGALRKL